MRDEGQSRVEISHANAVKVQQLGAVLGEVLAEVLRKGFYGGASIELVVVDGTIQSVGRQVKRVER